jgi:hypothetical protein
MQKTHQTIENNDEYATTTIYKTAEYIDESFFGGTHYKNHTAYFLKLI